MSRNALGAVIALLSMSLIGCTSEFERIEFTLVSSPPGSVSIAYEQIRMWVGLAAGLSAVPKDEDGATMDEDTSVVLATQDPDVLFIGSLGSVYDDEPFPNYVFVSTQAGSTGVIVTIDGTQEGVIPVVIDDQPVPE